MRLRTAKKAHDLIGKRNEIKNKSHTLLNILTAPYSWESEYFDKKHVVKLCAYYEGILDEELGKVDSQIEKL